MMTETAVLEALAELGTTSSEIAAKLEAAGVKGRRYAACECPIAVYLARRFGQSFTCYECATAAVSAPVDACCLPAAVAHFVDNFDRGRYPDLELAL